MMFAIIAAVVFFLAFLIAVPFLAGLRLYRVINNVAFKKHIKFFTSTTDNEPDGYFCGWPFVGRFNWKSGGMTIVTTKAFYNAMIVPTIQAAAVSPSSRLWFVDFQGRYSGYSQKRIDVPDFKERKDQSVVIDAILADYKERKFSVSILSGQPGSGKSMVGLLTAKRILESKIADEVMFCESWDPTQSDQTFSSLVGHSGLNKSKPLVIIIDEADEIIRKIHEERSQSHQFNGTIKNKADWNRLFDRFDRGIYRHAMIIMTTNKPLQWFNEIDPSFIRPGRVNLQVTL
jgi:hypothetical protein